MIVALFLPLALAGLPPSLPASGSVAASHASAVQVHEGETASVDELRAALQAAREAQAKGEHARGRELLAAQVEDLLARLAAEDDADLALLGEELGSLAHALGGLSEAERIRRAVLGQRRRTLPPDDPIVLALTGNLAVTLKALGDLTGARELEEAVLVERERSLPADHPRVLVARQNLAATLFELRDMERSGVLFESVLEARLATLPADHPDLLLAQGNAALTRAARGDLHGARELEEEVLRARERTLPAGDPELLRAKQNLAFRVKQQGELERARALELEVLEARRRSLPPEHPALLSARENLASTLFSLGDLEGARELFEEVIAGRERILAADHPAVLLAKANLATIRWKLGDLASARSLADEVLQARQRQLHPDHHDVAAARRLLGAILFQLGDLEAGRAQLEAELATLERTLPAEHPAVLRSRINLAQAIKRLGDLTAARRIELDVLDALERSLPEDDPSVLQARSNLASTLLALGDSRGARANFERVVAGMERVLAEDHPELLFAQQHLAGTLLRLGQVEEAKELFQAVLHVRERALPPDHPDLAYSRVSLAAALHTLGDLAAARELLEEVLEVRGSVLPAHHPDLLFVRKCLGATLLALGSCDEAVGHLEHVASVEDRLLSPDHPNRITARLDLAMALAEQAALRARSGPGTEDATDDKEITGPGSLAIRRSVELVAEAVRAQVQAARTLVLSVSPREAEERITGQTKRPLDLALSFATGKAPRPVQPSLLEEAFVLSESTRASTAASAAVSRGSNESAERRVLREELRSSSAQLAELVRRGAHSDAYHVLRERREKAEQGLIALASAELGERAGILQVDPRSLTARLAAGDGLVAFRRFARSWLELDTAASAARDAWRSEECLGAFVLTRPTENGEAQLEFVDLGPIEVVEHLVASWRAEIGVGSGAVSEVGVPTRGLGLAARAEGDGRSAGRAVRRRVWDPLLGALGASRRVVLALDDVLHLVPFDALPQEEEGLCLGDAWRLETRVAAWELLLDPPSPRSDDVLVALGGADFDLAPLAGGERARGAGAPLYVGLRAGGLEETFAPLAHTEAEARSIAELFAASRAGPAETLLLTGSRASRGHLEEAAPRARWLHVATHGWFAPTSIRAWGENSEDPTRAGSFPLARADAEEVVRGMSPLVLCGLALAGANVSAEEGGDPSALLTAEELATVELSGCELAVLSACDTNVGRLSRAGQGVASLQRALHTAGAASAVTSLWKVPDEATAELMLDFYRRLWVERKPKHQALWEAKRRLREARDERGHLRYATRDWAAWVLTGEPN